MSWSSVVTDAISSGINSKISTAINKAETSVAQITGMGFTPGSFLSAMNSRDDPLLNIDWSATMSYPSGPQFSPEYIEEVTLPFIKIDPEGVFREGSMVYIAKHRDIEQLNLKFYCGKNLYALNYMHTWKELVGSYKGVYTVPAQYKGTIVVKPLDSSGTELATLEFTGVWPSATDAISFGSGQTERIVITQSFSVDTMTLTLTGATGNAAATGIGGFVSGALSKAVGKVL